MVSNVVADDTWAYWADVDGDIMRGSLIGTSSNVIAVKEIPTRSGEVAVDDNHVWWTENFGSGSGKLFRAPKTGGSRQLVHSNADSSLRQLRTDGLGGALFITNVPSVFCCVDILRRVVPAGGSFPVTTASAQGVGSFATYGPNVYYAARFGGGSRPTLRVAPLADLSMHAQLAQLDRTSGTQWPALAVNANSVFVQEFQGTGPIYRVPRTGGTPERITGFFNGRAQQILASDRWLFVLVGHEIYRYAVDVGARTLDLVGNDRAPEAIQVIQSLAHDVPLITNKRTLVRAFGRIGTSSEGATELRFSPEMLLYGRRADGSSLPGSPLRPLSYTPIRAAGSIDRTNMNTSFLFELPRDWTRGTITLTSRLNPGRVRAETNYANNDSQRTITFNETRGLCLDVLPVWTTSGTTIAAWSPGIVSHFERAKSLLPTARVRSLFRGGTPRSIPLTGEPYDMFNDFHHGFLLFNLSVEFLFSGAPHDCGSLHTIRTGLMRDASRFGMSYGAGPYMWALTRGSTTPVENAPVGGVRGVAHETGHQLGSGHVLCPMTGDGAPAGPDGAYPYNTCRIDDSNNHIGMDVMTRTLIVPRPADGPEPNDYMSYGPLPQWVSDYTYKKHYRTLGGASSAMTVSAANQSPAGVVIGGVFTANGDSHMSGAYPGEDGAAALIAETTEPNQSYQLRTYDSQNAPIEAVPLNVGDIDDASVETLMYFHQLDTQQIAKLEVVRIKDQKVLATRSAGILPPNVTPGSLTVDGNTLNVSWSAFDPDKDPLTYLVRYSSDGGNSYRALASELKESSLSVDLSQLPGSPKALVQVLASDGLHATTATFQPFAVTNKKPDAYILGEDFSELTEKDTVKAAQSETVRFFGHGRDVEDGELSEKSLQWEIEGPVYRQGFGEELALSDLPPGTYQVDLSVTDSSNQLATARTNLQILAKAIHVAAKPKLDGYCDDDEYAQDDEPLSLRSSKDSISDVRMISNSNQLYFCFAGLPMSDPSARVKMSTGQEIFSVFQNGFLEIESGQKQVVNSGAQSSTEGIVAAVSDADDSWHAELRIDAARLGEGTVSLTIAHLNDEGVQAAWPSDPSAVGALSLTPQGSLPPPTNTAPIAAPDAYEVLEDGKLVVQAPGVLVNDADADNDALTALLVGESEGTLQLNANGGFTYVPEPDFNGIDAFAYVATDAKTTSEIQFARIEVLPVQDPPVAIDDSASTTPYDAVVIDVVADDSDPDGDQLQVASFTQPTGGSVSLNGDGTLTFTPGDTFDVSTSFKYTIKDPAGNTATATVTVNEAPCNGSALVNNLDPTLRSANRDVSRTIYRTNCD